MKNTDPQGEQFTVRFIDKDNNPDVDFISVFPGESGPIDQCKFFHPDLREITSVEAGWNEDELAEHLISAGLEHPMTEKESEKLLTKIFNTIQADAITRGDHETLANLDGDPRDFARKIIKKGR